MKKRDLPIPILLQNLQQNGDKEVPKSNLCRYVEENLINRDFKSEKVNLPNTVRSTFLMVFSPDGSKIASTHGDHKIHISSINTSKIIKTLEGHPRTPWCLTFHPSNANLLASGCLGGQVRIWDLKTEASETWQFTSNNTSHVISSLCFHPSKDLLCIATYNQIHFWDWRKGKSGFLVTLSTSQVKQKVRYAKFDCTGTKLITGISNLSDYNHFLNINQPCSINRNNTSHFTRNQSQNESHNLYNRPRVNRSRYGFLYDFDRLDNLNNIYSSNLINELFPQDTSNNVLLSETYAIFNNRLDSITANDYNPNVFGIRRTNVLSRILNICRRLEYAEENRISRDHNDLPSEPDGVSDEEELNTIIETTNIVERFVERCRILNSNNQYMDELNSSNEMNNQQNNTTNNRDLFNLSTNHNADFFTIFNRLLISCNRLPTKIRNMQESQHFLERMNRANSGRRNRFSNEIITSLEQINTGHNILPQIDFNDFINLSVNENDINPSSASNLDSLSTEIEILNSIADKLRFAIQLITNNLDNRIYCNFSLRQMKTRFSELLERMQNVSNYRDKLVNLRNQLNEFLNTNSLHTVNISRYDLVHCLWLVNMSINLSRQLHRVILADIKIMQLTQLTLFRNTIYNRNLQSNNLLDTENSNLNQKRKSNLDNKPKRKINLVASLSAYNRNNQNELINDPIPSTSNNANTDRINNIYDNDLNSQPLIEIKDLNNTTNSENQINHNTIQNNVESHNETRNHFFNDEDNITFPIRINSSSTNSQINSSSFIPNVSSSDSNYPNSFLFNDRYNFGLQNFINLYNEFSVIGHDLNFTYRIQCWDFSIENLPNLKDTHLNVIVKKCKIHNDASIDLSSDGNLLACLVPIEVSGSVNLCVYSLKKKNFAQCLYTWAFNSNAISVSLSPTNRYLIVGLSSPRMFSYLNTSGENQMIIAQVFELKDPENYKLDRDLNNNFYMNLHSYCPKYGVGVQMLKKVRTIEVSRGTEVFSVNSLRWLPISGEGFIYGTNKGHLIICKPFGEKVYNCKNIDKLKSSTGTQTLITGTITNNFIGIQSLNSGVNSYLNI